MLTKEKKEKADVQYIQLLTPTNPSNSPQKRYQVDDDTIFSLTVSLHHTFRIIKEAVVFFYNHLQGT